MIKTTKIQKITAALVLAVLLCSGCTDKTQTTTSDAVQTSKPETTAKSIDEIYQEITKAVTLQSPACMDEDFISNYYGIDTKTLSEYVFSMSEDAAQAETIIIMKAAQTEDLEGLSGCLQTVVEEKKNEMENYIPEQFAIVEKSKVQTKGNYVWLVISENAESITDIIENSLS